MYTPKHFEMNDPAELTAFMQYNNFAALVTSHNGEITATHLPFMLDAARGEHGTLVAHLARTNPQWQTFASGQDALVIFTGPHAYVSPSWYEKPSVNVPTWNYTAVHAYGVPRVVEDPAALHAMLEQLVHAHESSFAHPWPMDSAEEHVQRLMGGVVGFEMTISRIEGKYKLSQNRSEADQQRVMEELSKSRDSVIHNTGVLMRKRLK